MTDLSDSEIQFAFDRARRGFSKRIILMTIGMVLTGCITVSLFKYQTKRQGLSPNFISLQTFFVLFSQFINFVIFFLRITLSTQRLSKHFLKYRNNSYSHGKQYEFKSRIILPSSLFSCAASLLQLYALTSLSSGFFQMFFGFGIAFTPLLSLLFLKRKLYRHIRFGIGLCLLAFVIVLISSFFLGQVGFEEDGGWKAILLAIAGVFLSSCQRVHQEQVHNQVEISPFRYSGLEGFFGTIILFGFHVIMAGVNGLWNTQYFDIAAELVQWFKNDQLVWSSLLLVLCLSIYDLLGLALISRIGATYRVTSEVTRVIFLWGIDLFIYREFDNTASYWVNVVFIILAYGLLVFGTLVINELVEITFWGLNKNFGLYSKSSDLQSDDGEQFPTYQEPAHGA